VLPTEHACAPAVAAIATSPAANAPRKSLPTEQL
jgi:hypothetical protein